MRWRKVTINELRQMLDALEWAGEVLAKHGRADSVECEANIETTLAALKEAYLCKICRKSIKDHDDVCSDCGALILTERIVNLPRLED